MRNHLSSSGLHRRRGQILGPLIGRYIAAVGIGAAGAALCSARRRVLMLRIGAMQS